MKKILFLVVVLLSVVSAKLYSSNQELVQEQPVVEENVGLPGDGGCIYREGGGDCSVGSYNGCSAINEDGKCNSDPIPPG